MGTATEYERKYALTIEQQQKLIPYLGKFDRKFRQVDRYFDSKDAILYRRGIFMRIRGDRFQVKYNLDDVLSGKSSGHTECTENNWRLIIRESEQAELKSILSLLGIECPDEIATPFSLFDHHSWVESVIIDKTRAAYNLQNYTISLDEVAGLGIYVEIESSTKEPTPTSEERRLFSFIAEQDLDYIDTGYNALHWRKYNREIYMNSPYVMKRDKNI